MPDSVFTNNTRFKFVKGWITGGTDPSDGSVEVGDYTEFPLEITGETIAEKLDKIAEIFHRAREAQITENTLSGITGISFGTTLGTISPLVMYSDSDGGTFDNYLRTGYHTLDQAPLEVYDDALPYLGSQYTETFFDGVSGTGTFRDIAERERGIHLPIVAGFNPYWNYEIGSAEKVQTAFTFESYSASGTETQPSIPIPWVTDDSFSPVVYETLEFRVAIGYRVAVIFAEEGASILHPVNRFFLEILVYGNIQGISLSFQSIAESGFSTTSATYTMRISSGDISLPLCCTDSGLSGEIVHEVTKWWPYQIGSPPTSIFDPDTGLKL